MELIFMKDFVDTGLRVSVIFLLFAAISCAEWRGEIWTDRASSLKWEVAPTSEGMSHAEATLYCRELSLAGGDWRLPTISELRSLLRGCPETESGGSCGIEDDCAEIECLDDSCACWDNSCLGCGGNMGPSEGCYWPDEIEGLCGWYWSSTLGEDNDRYAWFVRFSSGRVYVEKVDRDYEGDSGLVRCVR